jgi:MSHA biogenesis protein MshP
MNGLRQRGFAIIWALFLITAVAAAGAAMVTTLAARSRTTVQNLDAARAFYAAYSGLEIAAARALSGSCANATETIEGFSVALSCTQSADVQEGASTYRVYTLAAIASRGSFASSSFVSRRLRATLTDAPPP